MFRRFLCCVLATAGLWVNGSSVHADDSLTIGSDAPALDIEHWVHDGQGKFPKVTKFEPGKVYVVEFWATWCGPCIMSMPHLAETQNKYASQGVQIISISDEDLETVEKFLEGKVPDQKDAEKAQTYRELTSAYCLTTDPDQSVYADYMDASSQGGIPTAFIVGKDQKIEWIGHPMEMDEPLEQVVSGKWDRQQFVDVFKAKQEAEAMMQEVSMAFGSGQFEKALELLNNAIEKTTNESVKIGMYLGRLQAVAEIKELNDKLPETAIATFEAVKSQPEAINQAAWMLVNLMEENNLEKDKKIIQAALAATEAATKTSEGDVRAAIMDTMAHLQHLNGDLDAALITQKAAVALASEATKGEMQGFLERLEEEKKKK